MITYNAQLGVVSNQTLGIIRVLKSESEILGSRSSGFVGSVNRSSFGRSFIANISAGNIVKLQFMCSSASCGLFGGGSDGIMPAASFTITKVQ